MTYTIAFAILCILLRMLPMRSRIKLASLHNYLCARLVSTLIWIAFHAGRLLLGTKPIVMYAISVNANYTRKV